MLSENKPLKLLFFLSVGLILAAFAMVLFYAPVEQTMGLVQKVFYFHMSAAWVGMLAFLVAAVCGVLYLAKKELVYDAAAFSAVEMGLLFTAIATFTGMIWAEPIWNTWWTWDPRLTTMTIMAFTYIAYLLLRRGIDEPVKRARFGAIYAIIGFASVPLTFFSSRLLRTIHPTIFGGNSGDMALTLQMYQTMAASLVAFTLLFAVLLWYRARLAGEQALLESLRAEQSADEFGEVENG
ncbi:MAG TPA: cytochrome c biogenesis protein CcsA [Chloroflexi bacterium]|jgi:heme exporter protein C|nr:cytochrome c biogenesis protein CcsA [Chloroflexota bacterium]